MVSCDGRTGTVAKRRRASGASPGAGALAHTARQRKQRLVAKLTDSGFEEDLAPSPVSSPARSDASRASGWYLQYGDVGYSIQREREAHFHPCRSLARQPQVGYGALDTVLGQLTAEARCKLVSWLIPVHRHLRLSFECCCLAVNIMDRFLASTAVAADCFQLLGVTALLLASKQVEVCSPRISHLLSLCCDAFTKEQLCNLECLVLLRLNFRLSAPTLAFFLDFYTSCTEAARLVTESKGGDGFARKNPVAERLLRCSGLARRVCELSLADYAFNKYPPSLTARCALRLAGELLNTEQGLAEHATIQSHEDQWDSFVDETSDRPAFAQPTESPEISEGGSLTAKGRFLPAGQESYDHNLARECEDNLRLLASLNQETLEGMSTM